MPLQVDLRNAVLVLRMEGELDAFEVQTLRESAEQALQQEYDIAVVEGSGLTMLDSSGIGLLVYLFKQASARQRPFALVGLQGQPEEMIRFLKVDRRIPLHPTVEAARQALGASDR
ncbi:MAG: STAS domain-containing protein [Oceanococcaceae bacterium]